MIARELRLLMACVEADIADYTIELVRSVRSQRAFLRKQELAVSMFVFSLHTVNKRGLLARSASGSIRDAIRRHNDWKAFAREANECPQSKAPELFETRRTYTTVTQRECETVSRQQIVTQALTQETARVVRKVVHEMHAGAHRKA